MPVTLAEVALVPSRLMDPGFAKAAREGLERRGLSAVVGADGDRTALAARCLVLMGSLASLRRTAAMIEAAGARRPRVLAWMSEPLPPPDLPEAALRFASVLSPARFGSRRLKPFLCAASWPLDRWLASRDGRGLSATQLRFCIDNLVWLRRGLGRGWLDGIGMSTEQKRRALAGMGIAASFLPVGQQPGFGRDLGLARDIDVLFIGGLKGGRRPGQLATLAAKLRADGLTVHLPEAPIWGEERTRLVNRARILLHVHKFDWDTPWMRWCLASANGAVIASEPLSVPEPFRPGIDYLSAPAETLAREIAALAADEPRRLAMAAACRETIAAHLTLDHSLDRLAQMIRSETEKATA